MYGDAVLELLSDFAVERAYDAPWSEEHMRAISKEDTAIDSLLDEANQYDWLWGANEVIMETPPEKSQASAFLINRAREDDSVSTFQSKKTRDANIELPSKKKKVNRSNDSSMADPTQDTVPDDST